MQALAEMSLLVLVNVLLKMSGTLKTECKEIVVIPVLKCQDKFCYDIKDTMTVELEKL